MKVLIVDDDKEIIELTKNTFMAGMGDVADVAYDGEEALNKMKDDHYDLVVLAVLIPGASGMEVMENMMHDEKLKNIPVLLMSVLPLYSESFHNSLNTFEELSLVKDLLEKPFSSNDLMSKVEHIIHTSIAD
ncbi:hypothetical protein COB64_00435 [Candidatus Wolfebacteria bacterium]|nr:MAG: hypothetical protein COB64_00435 [Candidatus Wolfebacteria bacterium]